MAKKTWVQKADRGIQKAGTEGALTRQAKARGWSSALPFARAVVKAWERSKKTGKPPTVLNKKTGKQSTVDLPLWRRANFAVNVQPKNGNSRTSQKKPTPARKGTGGPYSVRIQQSSGAWKTATRGLTRWQAEAQCRSLKREGLYGAIFRGRKMVWDC